MRGLPDPAHAWSEALADCPLLSRMKHHRFHRSVILCLLGGTLLQAGGCIATLVPSVISLVEQQALSTFVIRLLPL